MNGIGRGPLVGLGAAALIVTAASAAGAHAAYKSSNPADRSTVGSPPAEVTAEFTEPLTQASSMAVFDPCGDQVDGGDSRVNGYEMSVSMSGSRAGTYTVEFKAQSSFDSHTTSGTFTFTSSSGDPCPGSEPPPEPGGGGGSGSGGGAGSGGGGAGAGSPQDPIAPAAPGAPTGTARDAADGTRSRATDRSRPSVGRRDRTRPEGRGVIDGPVAFQNTGDRTSEEPSPWDLPVGGVLMSVGLCVLIGAAGGRVYAGIVAPPRR